MRGVRQCLRRCFSSQAALDAELAEEHRRIEAQFFGWDSPPSPPPLQRLALPAPRRVWSPYDPEGLRHVEVGTVLHTGAPWEFSPWGFNHFIAGESGAGKSNLTWAFFCALADRIEAGLVKVHAIDPKGGMESRMGPGFFSKMADHPDRWAGEAADLINDVKSDMTRRILKVRGTTQTHVPTQDEPLHIIWFDEMSSIMLLGTPAKQEPIVKPLAEIMKNGRAIGYSVIGAVQDPRWECVPVMIRNLFQRKVGLRLASANLVDMVMGQGAREEGAKCDLIRQDQPGVAFDRINGRLTLVRSRYVDADTIRRAELRAAGR